MNNIPQHATQHAFDFESLEFSPIEEVAIQKVATTSQKREPRKDFYTYRLIRSDTGLTFYAGKGQKARMYAHISNAKHHGDCNHKICNTIRKLWRNGYEVIHEKIADGITEAGALALEKLFISLGAVYRWPLVNHSNGGEIGPTGRIMPPDEVARRAKIVKETWSDSDLRQLQREAVTKQWQNEEIRAKRIAGQDNPDVRKKMGDRLRGKHNDDLAKTYPGFVSPDGTTYKDVFNLHRFCQEHNLQISNMCNVASGKEYAHKGWKAYPLREAPVKKTMPPKTPYTGFVSPDGQIYHVTSTLKAFCQEHGLTLGAMSNVNAGKWPSHKGWTKYNP